MEDRPKKAQVNRRHLRWCSANLAYYWLLEFKGEMILEQCSTTFMVLGFSRAILSGMRRKPDNAKDFMHSSALSLQAFKLEGEYMKVLMRTLILEVKTVS